MAAYASTTRTTLRTRIRERIFNTFWSDTELNAYINEALRVWNILTGYTRVRASSAFGAVSYPYVSYAMTTFSNTYPIALLRMDLTTGVHLDALDVSDLADMDPDWLMASTATASSPPKWVPLGLNRFSLYPGLVSGSITIRADILKIIEVPTADGDYIQVGDEDLDAIINYVQFLCALKEGGAELKAAIPLMQNFLQAAASLNSKLTKFDVYRRFMGQPSGGQIVTRPKREGK